METVTEMIRMFSSTTHTNGMIQMGMDMGTTRTCSPWIPVSGTTQTVTGWEIIRMLSLTMPLNGQTTTRTARGITRIPMTITTVGLILKTFFRTMSRSGGTLMEMV